jgi:hypothetical protein
VVKQLTDVGMAGAVRCVQLVDPTGQGLIMSPAMFDALKQLPVQSLALEDVACEWNSLAVLTQLSFLDLGSRLFTPDEYAALPAELSSLPSLRELVISRPYNDKVGWAHNAFVARVAQSSPQLRLLRW